MEHTSIYGFNLMEGKDPVRLTPLNENTHMIEEALAPTLISIPAYSEIGLERHNVFLKREHPLTVGPCTAEPGAYAGAYDPLYDELVEHSETVILGETGYACKGAVAYRLDHKTKTASVLLDLSGHVTESHADGCVARALCADESYVFFVEGYYDREAGAGSATFVKFDHTGSVLLTRTTADLNEVRWDESNGFLGTAPTFAFRSLAGDPYPAWQTKDAFGIRPYTTGWNGDRFRYTSIHMFSKATLTPVCRSDNVPIYYDVMHGPAYVRSTLDSNYLLVREEVKGTDAVYQSTRLFHTLTGDSQTSWLSLGGTQYPYNVVIGSVGDYVLLGGLRAAEGDDAGYSCIRMSGIQSDMTCALPYLSASELYITSQRELLQWYDCATEAINYRGADYPVDQANMLDGEPVPLKDAFETPCFCRIDGKYWFRQGDSYYTVSLARGVYSIDHIAQATDAPVSFTPGTGGTGSAGGSDGAGGIHIIDVGTGDADLSTLDFSGYSAGDVIVVVGDLSV